MVHIRHFRTDNDATSPDDLRSTIGRAQKWPPRPVVERKDGGRGPQGEGAYTSRH